MRKKKSFDPKFDHIKRERYEGGMYYDCRFGEKQPEPKTKAQKVLERNKEKYFEK